MSSVSFRVPPYSPKVHVAVTTHSFFSMLGNVESRLLDGGFSRCIIVYFIVECVIPVELKLECGHGHDDGNDDFEV
jgi:hypothetical protein